MRYHPALYVLWLRRLPHSDIIMQLAFIFLSIDRYHLPSSFSHYAIKSTTLGGEMAGVLNLSLGDWRFKLDPGRVIPKTIKMVRAASLLDA